MLNFEVNWIDIQPKQPATEQRYKLQRSIVARRPLQQHFIFEKRSNSAIQKGIGCSREKPGGEI